jgi:hypothetical protein
MKTSSFPSAKLCNRFRAIGLSLFFAGLFCFGAPLLRATDGIFGNVTAGGNLTVGNGTITGNNSLALGDGTLAQTWSTTTVGHYNAPIGSGNIGNTTLWTSKDPAFTVGTGNSTLPATGLSVLNSGIIYSGAGTTTDSSTNMILGNGSYIELVPKNGIFLDGYFTGNGVDTSSNSYGDVGIGYTIALSGPGSVAIGSTDTGNPYGGVAIGWHAYTGQSSAVAIGAADNAYEDGDVDLGDTNATGFGNGVVALGAGNSAYYNGAVVIGYNNNVSDAAAVGIGEYNLVNGGNSTAIGAYNNVTGNGTIALGANLTTIYDHTLVAGKYNLESGNLTGGNQPLFELGNGTSNTTLSNAFTVLQNGNTTVSGNLTVSGGIAGNLTIFKRQGDIIMGTYGNGGGD